MIPGFADRMRRRFAANREFFRRTGTWLQNPCGETMLPRGERTTLMLPSQQNGLQNAANTGDKLPRLLWEGQIAHPAGGRPFARLVETEETVVCEFKGEEDALGQARWAVAEEEWALGCALKAWFKELRDD